MKTREKKYDETFSVIEGSYPNDIKDINGKKNKSSSFFDTAIQQTHTPKKLVQQMVDAVNIDSSKRVLIICNVEFIIELWRRELLNDNIFFISDNVTKTKFAENIGVDPNNIYELDYNKKEINLGTEMKFDVIIQNPPYNPNSLWKKFVLKGIELLNDNGQMVAIHPDSWRKKTSHTKIFNHLKQHISELHIKEFSAFPGINISTDWYLYNKTKQNNIKIYYNNDDVEIVVNDIKRIYSFSQTSIPSTIINKICTKDNNGIIIKNTGFNLPSHNTLGTFKQCGGKGNGTGWTNGNFVLTDEPTKHQYENKVVMSYTRKPRAQYFNDNTGVIKAYYWLTDNQSLPILLNSKMIWKLFVEIEGEKNLNTHPGWFLKSLNFDGLTAQTEEELYEHYGLTEEEIEWIEKE